jgi:hypothetical protein
MSNLHFLFFDMLSNFLMLFFQFFSSFIVDLSETHPFIHSFIDRRAGYLAFPPTKKKNDQHEDDRQKNFFAELSYLPCYFVLICVRFRQ